MNKIFLNKIFIKLFYILNMLILLSCQKSSEKENAIKYIKKVVTDTNNAINPPARISENTIAERVIFDENTNTIIYTYVIENVSENNKKDFLDELKEIEKNQIERAKKMQGKNKNYQILNVTIFSVYKDQFNDTIYSFKITPNMYLGFPYTVVIY